MQTAAKPRIPEPTAAQLAAREKQATYLRGRGALESRSIARGLALLGILLLLVALYRGGLARIFPQGWWRP